MNITEGQLEYIKSCLAKIYPAVSELQSTALHTIDSIPHQELSELEKVGLDTMKEKINTNRQNVSQIVFELHKYIVDIEKENKE